MQEHPTQNAAVRRLVIGVTGASGAVYARRLIQLVTAAGIETHLVVSPLGQRLLHDELGMEGLDRVALAGDAERAERVVLHNYRDVGAPIASGSFRHDGMIIAPCSSNSLAAVATGASQNLVHRAAAVTLKERRRLVLLHRETPLALADIRNMESVTLAGGIVMPAAPGFYMLPRSIEELVDFLVARLLDLVDVPHDLDVRWCDPQTEPRETPRGASR